MENGNEMVTKSMFLEGMDGLARLVNQGFMDIEKRMATKDELRVVEGRLSYAIGQVDAHLSAYATQWNKEFESLSE